MNKWIHELNQSRKKIVNQFRKYKNSLKYQGEVKKEDLPMHGSDVGKKFFTGFYTFVQEIVKKIGGKPTLLGKMLAATQDKKIINADFAQSILYHLYPCYLPSMINTKTTNNCLLFVQEVINRWNYNIEHGRPLSQTVIDQIINGFNKSPEIVCYVHNITTNFLKQLQNFRMQSFTFDQQAIKHELAKKKQRHHFSLSVSSHQRKSLGSKLKSLLFKKQNEDIEHPHRQSWQSQNDNNQDEINIIKIMESRQQQYPNMIIKAVEIILGEEIPFLLGEMMRIFHRKIRRQMEGRNCNKQIRQQKQNDSRECGKKYYEHYCYFLLTNLINGEINYQFTKSYEETGLKAEKLQNFTQIIRIMTQLFKGGLPHGKKYKNQKFNELKVLLPKIYEFYQKIINSDESPIVGEISRQKSKDELEVRQTLLNLHQGIHILSFNDIRVLLNIIRSSEYLKQLQLSPRVEKMQFMSQSKIASLFQPGLRQVQFQQKRYEVEKIYFIFNSSRNQKPCSSLVGELSIQHFSMLTQLIKYGINEEDMFGSHLKVREVLLVKRFMQLIQSFMTKEMKYYLKKFLTRSSELYGDSIIQVKDSEILLNEFRNSIQHNIKKIMQRKWMILLYLDQISKRIKSTEKLIEYYTSYARNAQFYDRISLSFIANIKIRVYLRIQKEQLEIYTNTNQMKGVNLQYLLATDVESKSKRVSQDNLLRNSYKSFTSITELIDTLARNKITEAALTKGRKVDQFNEMFRKLCSVIISQVEQFIKKTQVLQNLNKNKLCRTIITKIQHDLYNNTKKIMQVSDDRAFNNIIKNIDTESFFNKQLKELNVDWGFFQQQGRQKFQLIMSELPIMERIRHFEEMFRIVFAILGFSIPKDKITAEIVNPVIQYLILKSNVSKHYECLYSFKALKWNTTPQTIYNIILYESSLTYITKDITKDMSYQYSFPNQSQSTSNRNSEYNE